MDTEKSIDFSARYMVEGWRGVAYRLLGYAKVWEPSMFIGTDDQGEDYEYEEPGEGEWVDDTSRVIAVMVGDDHKQTVDIEDLTVLGELDYCSECGQVGCSHDRRDRSEDA